MGGIDDAPHVEVASRAEWRAWLEQNHDVAEGVWVVTYKKHRGDKHVPWPDVVREALCFGWIDSRTRRVDDDRMKVWVTRRRPGSVWSATNKSLVAELEEAGLLAPAGVRLIEAARADGSWAFLDDIEALVEPDDLRAALDVGPAARARWDATPPNVRKRALYWVKTAKTEPTRATRVASITARCAAGEPPV